MYITEQVSREHIAELRRQADLWRLTDEARRAPRRHATSRWRGLLTAARARRTELVHAMTPLAAPGAGAEERA